ncbi:MAG: hypothetical protein Greene07147_345 [Parcubacteria group bacterium Greene0714_7]|nr:MAG: hypothetical protein Greene07147_345 [Parcubacteria group bacterium Greene0714_7]
MGSMIAFRRFAFPAFKIFFMGAFFSIVLFSAVPQLTHAGPNLDGGGGGEVGGCSGTTWEYDYTIVTNPFPPGSAGEAAFRAVYGGDSYVVQSSYQVARIDEGNGCIEEPTTLYVGIIATPSSISSGGSSLLTWTSDYVTSCTGTNFSTGGATAGSLIVSPASSITYSITCTDGIQTVSSSATVTVSAPIIAPTATLSANPTSLVVGSSSTLTWGSTNATSCTGINFSTASANAGSVSVTPSQTTSYLVSCTGAGGSASASQTVTVSSIPTPTVSLSATPTSLNSGSSATLTWSSTNAVSCVGSGFETGGNTSGSISTGALSATTNYSITCTGASAVSSGIWQYSESDISDFACPLTDPNKAYSSVPTCPPNPTGKACSIPTCKVNTISACNINTDIYSCVGASPAVTPQTAFATANVQVNSTSSGVLSGSCSVSPTSVYTGSPVTWTASASGGAGSYTYSWSGTDSLSGTVASISKIYTTVGTKTASVTVTSPSGVTSVTLQGEKHCSGGTKVGSYGSTEDGVGFTGGANSAMAGVCSEITPAGGCCSVDVRETLNSVGQPVNTYYHYEAYSNASLASKTSTSGNTTRHNYFGGLATASAPASITASCSNSVVVGVSLSDLTTGSLTPLSVTAGVNSTFTAGVNNTGGVATPVFGSRMYVCLASDSACLNNYLTQLDSIWGRIFSLFIHFAEANTSIKIALSRISISAGGSGTETGSYTFLSPGAYQMRFCADTPLNEVNESNELDNCSAWTPLTVNPGTLTASCSPSPSTGYVGDSLIWTVTPSGGVGSYTYVWSGTDGLTGTGATVSKTYGTAGTKSASVIVTSGTGAVTATCGAGTIQNTPTVLITATPNTIIKGVTSPRIDWTSSYATSCTGTNFPTGSATVGSVTVSPPVTTTYGITCTSGTRSASSSATVTVNPADITLNISPAVTVRQGDPATVSWGVVGTPDSCSISGPGLSSTAFSGAQSVIINQQSTYTMNCLTGGVPSSKSVTIGVTPRFDEF